MGDRWLPASGDLRSTHLRSRPTPRVGGRNAFRALPLLATTGSKAATYAWESSATLGPAAATAGDVVPVLLEVGREHPPQSARLPVVGLGVGPGLARPQDRGVEVRGELARAPVRAAIQDPRTGERQTISVNENVFLSGLFRPLYVAELASLLPLGISAAAQGDFNPLLAQNLEFADDVSENLSIGMHLSVICAEDIPRITPEDMAKLGRSFFGRALVDDFMRACKDWPRGKVPADFYDPVRSDVPTLIFSGGIDPATPPHHGDQVAATLPNARHFVAPMVGHGVSLHGCAPRLIESFIRAGNARQLDGRCLERIPRPLFVLPLGAQLD